MLSENIKTLRKQKGLTQEELSVKLNVVRQTVSKWESGLSIPDAEMLVSLSNALDVPVNTLLDEDVSKKLNAINLPINQQKDKKNSFLGFSSFMYYFNYYFYRHNDAWKYIYGMEL